MFLSHFIVNVLQLGKAVVCTVDCVCVDTGTSGAMGYNSVVLQTSGCASALRKRTAKAYFCHGTLALTLQPVHKILVELFALTYLHATVHVVSCRVSHLIWSPQRWLWLGWT